MSYSKRQSRWVGLIGVSMICYAIITLVYLIMNGWINPGLLVLISTVLNFLLYLFTETNKKFTAVICMIIGFLALFYFVSVYFWVSVVFILLSLIALIILSKN